MWMISVLYLRISCAMNRLGRDLTGLTIRGRLFPRLLQFEIFQVRRSRGPSKYSLAESFKFSVALWKGERRTTLFMRCTQVTALTTLHLALCLSACLTLLSSDFSDFTFSACTLNHWHRCDQTLLEAVKYCIS